MKKKHTKETNKRDVSIEKKQPKRNVCICTKTYKRDSKKKCIDLKRNPPKR